MTLFADQDMVARWVNIAKVSDFASRARCTAAALQLTDAVMPTYVVPSASADRAVHEIAQGRIVALQVAGRTPHELSSALMTHDLARGLGLLGSVTGASDCMSGGVAALTKKLVNTPGAMTLFDPVAHSVLIVDFDQRIAVYLRTSA